MGLLDQDPFLRREPVAPPTPDPWVAVLAALDQLRAAIENTPKPVAPVVKVEAPDLTDVVMAVQAINGPATASDIAMALADVLAPRTGDAVAGSSDALEKVAKALELLEHRMRGISTQAYGGGSVSFTRSALQALIDGLSITIPSLDVSDRADRELGEVTVLNFPSSVEVSNDSGSPLPVSGTVGFNDFTQLMLARPTTTTVEIRREELTTDIYHGEAPDGTAESSASWKVVRLYLTDGIIVRIRYRTGVAWSARTSGWT